MDGSEVLRDAKPALGPLHRRGTAGSSLGLGAWKKKKVVLCVLRSSAFAKSFCWIVGQLAPDLFQNGEKAALDYHRSPRGT